MGRGIVRVRDLYCEWSTVVDAPISAGFDFQSAVRIWGEDRIERARDCGHSYRDMGPDFEYWRYNRAGNNETALDEQGLVDLLSLDTEIQREKRSTEDAMRWSERLAGLKESLCDFADHDQRTVYRCLRAHWQRGDFDALLARLDRVEEALRSIGGGPENADTQHPYEKIARAALRDDEAGDE